MASSHLHFIIQAYNSTGEGGQLIDVATVDVFADGEDAAIKRAQKLVKKQYYRVSQIVEHDPEKELAEIRQVGDHHATHN